MSLKRRLATFVEAFSLLRAAAPGLAALSLVVDLIGAVARAAMLGIAGRILGLLSEGTTWEQAVPWLIAATVALAVGMVSSSVHVEVADLAAERIEAHAVGQVLESAAHVPYEAFDSHDFYDRLERAYSSGSLHAWSIVQSTLSLIRSLFDLVAVGFVLLFVAPILIPISLLAFVPLWLVGLANNHDRYRFSWDETEPDRRRRYIESLLSDRQPAKEIRVFGMDQSLLAEFHLLWERRLQNLAHVVRSAALRSAAGHLLSSIVVTGALAVVVWLTIQGDLSLAQAGVGVLGVRQISGSVNGVMSNVRSLHKSHQFLNDYRDFRTEASELAVEQSGEPGPKHVSTIVFDNVGFIYPGAKHPTISGLNLTIRSGEVTAVVGANGAGKTTLLMLLSGMYRPTSGRILWDGVDTADYSPQQRYQTVAPLFQDFVQFHFTVAKNVAPTGDAEEDADIAAALELAGAAGYAQDLPDGVNTQLGKSFTAGAELSIGQWQRLALARALFCKAPIVLLDEPASALDPGAESRLVGTLQSTLQEQCVVMISHRFASVRQADTILVLDEGRLIETGNHDELVAVDGIYHALYRAQADPLLGSVGE